MGNDHTTMTRRFMLGSALSAIAIAAIPSAAFAKGLNGLIANASDNALDKLGQKDGFYRDLAVRILLPGAQGKLARSLLKTGDKLGLTTKLTRSLNDAASLAANEAKPVFREAINGLKLSDIPGIATQKDGGTQYLQRTAGTVLRGKVQPLVVAALGKVGAFNQLDALAQKKGLLGQFVTLAKLNQESLSDSVTDQAMTGIYKYMAGEEGNLRGKVSNIGDLIKGILN